MLKNLIFQNSETIEGAIDAEGAEAYRIVADGRVAGGLVLNVDASAEKGELELLFVSPHAHSKGIGQTAWRCVEELHPEVRVWGLVTPYFVARWYVCPQLIWVLFRLRE